jgi:hypothetical protein
MMSGSLVATVKPAHSSNVDVMTTKSPPSFCGVITTLEVDKLVKYSNLPGTDQYVDLRSICDKAAILTIESHLSARGHLCGFTKTIDYERWLNWDHRKFADFMVILFGEDQTRMDKSTGLLTTIIKFNFGLNDNTRLGDIRNTHSEQKVLFELSQHIENDFNPEHKTESGKMELVRFIHRNLKPDSIIMLAMNKDKPPATTPTEFFTKFLRVRSKHRAIWHSANDLGFFNPNNNGLSSHQSFSRQNTDSSQSTSQQKRQKRDDSFKEKKPFTKESCWSCGIQGHSIADCNRKAHSDRNQENVPFAQSAIGKRWAAQYPDRPDLSSGRLNDPARTPHAGTGKRITYSYDSNKAYLSYQNIKSYVSSLNNSSLSDFLFVTITIY